MYDLNTQIYMHDQVIKTIPEEPYGFAIFSSILSCGKVKKNIDSYVTLVIKMWSMY